MNTHNFQSAILSWYAKNQRDLPWRKTKNPYSILVSEMMLQQTQVDRVIPKYHAFLHHFPTIKHLANAAPADVIHAWAGLGYNRRAVNLHQLAQQIVHEHHGTIPRTRLQLQQFPGIGPYAASAIAAFAYNADVPVLDVNIHRILERYFAIHEPKPKAQREALYTLARSLLPRGQSSTWHNALMDFGATCCTAKTPDCTHCPLQKSCAFYTELQRTPLPERNNLFAARKKTPPFIGSSRYYRGKILALIRAHHTLTLRKLLAHLHKEYHLIDATYIHHLIEGLKKDHLITQNTTHITLPQNNDTPPLSNVSTKQKSN